MLSKENEAKLIMSGLYRCEPNKKYRGSIYWDNMYHCFNWTFRVKKNNSNEYFMVDTYFGDKYIPLTDKNFNEFELIFDFDEVEQYNGRNIYDYDENDYWHVATDSGGMYYGGHYYLRKDAKPNKDKVLQRLKEEIESAERNLKWKQEKYQKVLNDELDLKYV